MTLFYKKTASAYTRKSRIVSSSPEFTKSLNVYFSGAVSLVLGLVFSLSAFAVVVPMFSQCDKLSSSRERNYCQQLLNVMGIHSDQQVSVSRKAREDEEYLSESSTGLVVSAVSDSKESGVVRIHIEHISEELPKVVKVINQRSEKESEIRGKVANPPEGDFTLVELRTLGQKAKDLVVTFSEGSDADHRGLSKRETSEVEVSGNFSMAMTNSTDNSGRQTVFAAIGYSMLPLSQLVGWTFWAMHYFDYYVRKDVALIGCHGVSSYFLTWTLSFWVELVVYQCKKASGLPGVWNVQS